MKIGLSYKQNPIKEQFDVILIGSGIGSLACAAILAKQGKKCCVLEKHYTAGGYTHVFTRKGYEWDVGVHYIGDVNRPNTLLAQMFKYIGDGSLEWADMGEVYDKIIFGKDVYNFVKGPENFKNELKKSFPEAKDQKSIDDYVDLIYQANKTARGFFAEKAVPGLVSKLAGGFMRKSYMDFASKTTLEVLSEITDNKKLIGVLTGQYGDYGLPPSQSSFAMHATLVKHYLKGGAYPVGGSAQIGNSILPTIRHNGGEVYTNAGVETILFDGKKATGVRLHDGKEYFAPMIVSGAGYLTTYKHLVPDELIESRVVKNEITEVERSASHVSLYIGLKGTSEELGLQKANYWIYPDSYDHDLTLKKFFEDPEKDFPVTYISFPSTKDPSWQSRYPGNPP